MKLKFDLKKKNGNARRGQLTFERGTVQTPAFMPVGTYGTVKGMTPEEVKAQGRNSARQYVPLVAASWSRSDENAR